MNGHESNDPRKSEREAAERRRQARITIRLVAAIAVLTVLVVVMSLVQGRFTSFG